MITGAALFITSVTSAALTCAVVAWAAGGFSFARRPIGIVFLVIWFFWWLTIALYRRLGAASKYSRRIVVMTLALIPVYLVMLVVAPWEYGHYTGPIPRDGPLSWVGLVLFAAGALLSAWAMRTLRGSFTMRLNVVSGQGLVTTGPYAIVRNPAYLGYIMALFGLSLALSSLVGITLAFGAVIFLRLRIRREEQMLLNEFGDQYREYMQRTRRLFPFVY